MRIGVDFDNTLACYDGVFHAIALERGLVAADLPMDKTSVRDYLRARGQDAVFTELQGFVYGPGMHKVRPYPGAREALRSFANDGHTLFLISHKTRAPFAGPAYDLHEWAWRFLHQQALVGVADALFRSTDVYFELSRDAKLARIAAQHCDLFIDDLPEVLAAPGFPAATRRVLFDPENNYPDGVWSGHRFERCADWASIRRLVS
jgi:hypothetical protein